MSNRPKPSVHARDHEHGGADVTRIHYEDVGDSGAGGGIQFDTFNEGDWLSIETTGLSSGSGPGGLGIQVLADAGDLVLTAGAHNTEINADNDVIATSGRDTVWTANRDVAVNADREIDVTANTDVFIRVNDGSGGGNLILRNLPTSDPGVSGAVWNSGGTLMISP